MPKPGELSYFDRIGESGRQHAILKPFSDDDCGSYLMRVGALMNLLPPPPARILECGCGTGWLAHFLARRGYSVLAIDVASNAIDLARRNPVFRHGATPEFMLADSENLEFESTFDAVLFFDSLHHAVDEAAALRSAFRALKPGGICVALEPGRGHHHKSLDVESTYDVTEKDMPPAYVWQLGRSAGFARCRIFPSPEYLSKILYGNAAPADWRERLKTRWPFSLLSTLGIVAFPRWISGIVVLSKL